MKCSNVNPESHEKNGFPLPACHPMGAFWGVQPPQWIRVGRP